MLKPGDIVYVSKVWAVVKNVNQDRMTFKIEEMEGLPILSRIVFHFNAIERMDVEYFEKSRNFILNTTKIKEIADEIFGEDATDRCINGGIIIKFPELLLTNSDNYNHRIKDFFVKIELEQCTAPTGINSVGVVFRGARTSYTLKEIQSSYTHSHLPRGTEGHFHGFCLGGRSDFMMLVNFLQENPTEDNWRLFFLGLKNYLSWESLEGGPYIRMNTISYTPREIDMSVLRTEFKRLLGIIPDNFVTILDDTAYINFAHPDVNTFFCNNSKFLANYLGSTKDKLEECESLTGRDTQVIFKGKLIPLHVYMEETELEEEIKKLDPSIIEKYKEINRFLFNKFNKLKSLNHAKQQLSEKIFGKIGTFQ